MSGQFYGLVNLSMINDFKEETILVQVAHPVFDAKLWYDYQVDSVESTIFTFYVWDRCFTTFHVISMSLSIPHNVETQNYGISSTFLNPTLNIVLEESITTCSFITSSNSSTCTFELRSLES